MRAIFHIGLPKTGTTTLQNSLHAARGALAAHGILYPSLERFGHLNHHPLILSVLPPEKLPRQFRFKRAGSRERWRTRRSGASCGRSRAQGHGQLLLSSEYFSREFTEDELLRMQVLLARFGVTELTFSVYVRRPSAHYLSLLTQSLRHSAMLKPPASFRVRPRIEALRGAFPEARVVPALFEREVLVGGDIVADFVARFLGPLGVSPSEVPAQREANVSVSGESTEILMAFRRDAFPGRDNRPEPASAALFDTLAAIEARIGARRPLLRPEVAAWLDGADEDVAWLAEEYGLTFPGLVAGDAPPPPAMGRLGDVIEIDAAYRARLLEELARSPWAWRPWRRRWVRALAEGRVPGRVLPWV
jgi:hypothetical protein